LTVPIEVISTRAARRLALCRAGLLKPEWTGMPQRAAGRARRAREAAHRIIRRFGYLQLDTVSIAGARSHAIVLLSRLDGFDPELAEELLQPGEPIFEYWGHEASWIPIELYPVFGFRRQEFRHHPWWGDLVGQHPQVAADLLRRIRDEGPLRSLDMEGGGSRGWWDLKIAKKVATALWSSGELAIRERRSFQRAYDLPERVIPEHWREEKLSKERAIEVLVLRALGGHGWAQTGTLARTFRLAQKDVVAAMTVGRVAAGSAPPTSSSPPGLIAAGHGATGASSYHPSIPFSGTVRACSSSSGFTRSSRSLNRRRSESMATTACRYSPATVSSPA